MYILYCVYGICSSTSNTNNVISPEPEGIRQELRGINGRRWEICCREPTLSECQYRLCSGPKNTARGDLRLLPSTGRLVVPRLVDLCRAETVTGTSREQQMTLIVNTFDRFYTRFVDYGICSVRSTTVHMTTIVCEPYILLSHGVFTLTHQRASDDSYRTVRRTYDCLLLSTCTILWYSSYSALLYTNAMRDYPVRISCAIFT
ncbi:hypothetical protein J6590_062486 [Homalodisca vitripennis]|nr:hypothetical protein J6590_062486 [Homalodisca vitripennis]